MENSKSQQFQEYEPIVLKAPLELNTGREESSVTSQSTMAVVGDDRSLTNTSDTNEVTREFSVHSKEVKQIANYSNCIFPNEGQTHLGQNSDRLPNFNFPLQNKSYNQLGNEKKPSYRLLAKRNNEYNKGSRGNYFNGKDSYKKFKNFKDARNRKIPFNPIRQEYCFSQSHNADHVTLTRENLDKLNAEKDFLKMDTDGDGTNIRDATQATPGKDKLIKSELNFDEFFWNTKRQAHRLKSELEQSRKYTKAAQNQLSEDPSDKSSCNSNCGLVNQDSSLRDINLCDNQNDMWHGLKTSDGKDVYISSNRARSTSQHPPRHIRTYKRSKFLPYYKTQKDNFQLIPDKRRLGKWNYHHRGFVRNQKPRKIQKKNRIMHPLHETGIKPPIDFNGTHRRVYHEDMATTMVTRNMKSKTSATVQETPFSAPHWTIGNVNSFLISRPQIDTPIPDAVINNSTSATHNNDPSTCHQPIHKIQSGRKHLKASERKSYENNKFKVNTTSTYSKANTNDKKSYNFKKFWKKDFNPQNITQAPLNFQLKGHSYTQHPPDNTIAQSNLDKQSSRPIISYDDLELEGTDLRFDSLREIHQSTEKGKNLREIHQSTEKGKKLLHTSEARKHVQRLLAESRGLESS